MLMPVPTTRNFKRLEPYDVKLSSPVLRGWRKWQRFLCYQTLVLLLILSFNAIACEVAKKEGLRIFVSFSMPKELLVSLDKQAKQIGAKLVIRGLKNNSFKETFELVKSLGDIRVDIDPRAFDEYSINEVPAFVIMTVLYWLKIKNHVPTQVTIVKLTKLDKMTVSKILKQLFSQGYIIRFEDSKDTRAKTVQLTEQVAELVKLLLPIVEALDKEFFDKINASCWGYCSKSLRIIAKVAVPSF